MKQRDASIMKLTNTFKPQKFFDSIVHVKEKTDWYNTDKQANRDVLKKYFEDGHIDKAILTGMPGDNYEYTLKSARYISQNVVPVFSVEGKWLDGDIQYLKDIFRCYKSKGFRGVKIHPRFTGYAITHQHWLMVAEAAQSVGLFLMICTIHRAPVFPLGMSLHEALYDFCRKFKNLKIMLLHGGYYDLLAMSEVVRDLDNVLLDLSFTFMRFKKSSIALDAGYLFETLDRKISIGTDYPECSPVELFSSVDKYIISRDDIELTPDKLNNIFYNNINEFIKL